MTSTISRRGFLSGAVQGSAVVVALPLLDCFLNGNATALASGAPLPVRFGTWHWGCGVNSDRWVPDTLGTNFKFKPEMSYLEPFRDQISVVTGFNVPLMDAELRAPHRQHGHSRRAAPATNKTVAGETFDVSIARVVGANSRFRSIDVAATGAPGTATVF